MLAISPAAKRARAELHRQCGLCTLDEFEDDSRVIHEDGSTYFVRNSFTRVWSDPTETLVWIFLISEHNEPLYWCADDLLEWGTYKKIPAPGSVKCPDCYGFTVRPNRMDAPGGPVCGCGRPSRLQSGACGQPECDPTCANCEGIGWVWKA